MTTNSMLTSPAQTLDSSDVAAVFLSIFAPGLGHVLLGQTTKGLTILGLVIVSCGVGYLVAALIALDAWLVARTQKERPVGPWEVFPDHARYLGV